MKTLFRYFVIPLFKNIALTIKHIFLLDWYSVSIDFSIRLPLILKLGWLPLIQNFWFNWYKRIDLLKMKYLKEFNPTKTMSNIVNNIFCPIFVQEMYFAYITEDKSFRQIKIKFDLEN